MPFTLSLISQNFTPQCRHSAINLRTKLNILINKVEKTHYKNSKYPVMCISRNLASTAAMLLSNALQMIPVNLSI